MLAVQYPIKISVGMRCSPRYVFTIFAIRLKLSRHTYIRTYNNLVDSATTSSSLRAMLPSQEQEVLLLLTPGSRRLRTMIYMPEEKDHLYCFL
jgi:hypothetical protein